MKFGQIGPTSVDPEKTVIFWRVKSIVSSSTLKLRKSQKKLAPVYAYTYMYARKRDGGGKSAPPESNRVKRCFPESQGHLLSCSGQLKNVFHDGA